MQSVAVRHNFETAHRLPQLGGKCANLHGHSWWFSVKIEGTTTRDGIIVDFAIIKRAFRTWVDDHLDHGCMLGRDDPLVGVLLEHGTKLFVFGTDGPSGDLLWPTVENVSLLLLRVCRQILLDADVTSASVTQVDVQETHLNAASTTDHGPLDRANVTL